MRAGYSGRSLHADPLCRRVFRLQADGSGRTRVRCGVLSRLAPRGLWLRPRARSTILVAGGQCCWGVAKYLPPRPCGSRFGCFARVGRPRPVRVASRHRSGCSPHAGLFPSHCFAGTLDSAALRGMREGFANVPAGRGLLTCGGRLGKRARVCWMGLGRSLARLVCGCGYQTGLPFDGEWEASFAQ